MAMTEKNSAILRDRIHNLNIDNLPEHRESYENFRYKHFLLIFLILFFLPQVCRAFIYGCDESCGEDPFERNDRWTEGCQNQFIESIFGGEETPEYPKYRDFYFQIKTAIANDDRELFADLIHYPTYFLQHTYVDSVIKKETEEEIHEIEKIANREVFLAKYDQIVTDYLKQVVKKSEYRYLFVKETGIMIHGKKIWFNGLCTQGFKDIESYSKCLGLEIKMVDFNINKIIER